MKRECRETHEVAPIVDNVTLFMNYYYYTLNGCVLGRLQRYAAIKSGDTSVVHVHIWEEAIIKKSRSLLQNGRMIKCLLLYFFRTEAQTSHFILEFVAW